MPCLEQFRSEGDMQGRAVLDHSQMASVMGKANDKCAWEESEYNNFMTKTLKKKDWGK